MIVYARFEVSLHGMKLESEEQLAALRQRLADVVAEHVHPEGQSNIMDSDVEVELVEHAGLPTA